MCYFNLCYFQLFFTGDEQIFMKKKYSGMVFKKDPSITVRTEDEREVLRHLERKIHNNDLEDDFFILADGLREEIDEDSDESSLLELSNDEAYSAHNEEVRKETIQIQEEKQEPEKQGFMIKDCLSSLVESLNQKESRGFEMLSNFSKRKTKHPKKQRRVNTSIETCNTILSRMGAYIPSETDTEVETDTKASKRHKTEEKCDNWEDTSDQPKRNQPNII